MATGRRGATTTDKPAYSTVEPDGLWLEVTNVRMGGGSPGIAFQFRGERVDVRPKWWSVSASAFGEQGFANAADLFKAVTQALEKQRPVYGRLSAAANALSVSEVAIYYTRPEEG